MSTPNNKNTIIDPNLSPSVAQPVQATDDAPLATVPMTTNYDVFGSMLLALSLCAEIMKKASEINVSVNQQELTTIHNNWTLMHETYATNNRDALRQQAYSAMAGSAVGLISTGAGLYGSYIKYNSSALTNQRDQFVKLRSEINKPSIGGPRVGTRMLRELRADPSPDATRQMGYIDKIKAGNLTPEELKNLTENQQDLDVVSRYFRTTGDHANADAYLQREVTNLDQQINTKALELQTFQSRTSIGTDLGKSGFEANFRYKQGNKEFDRDQAKADADVLSAIQRMQDESRSTASQLTTEEVQQMQKICDAIQQSLRI
ncbi:MAG TPA: hypothetical protein VGJ00_05035 [Rhabdochlamydiaceae bacterium]|jgi:hypothetical protein